MRRGRAQGQVSRPGALITPPICVNCKRLRPARYGKVGLFCDAFPDGGGIPDAIKSSEADHRQPFAGDHGLQFLARSPEAAADAARIIGEAHPAIANVNLSNEWLYGWGDLPTTLDGLKARLKEDGVTVEDFKNSARYEANYDRFPWLKKL